MTLRHLRLFIEVYKTGNITKAAENMNMTQPTVTRAIQELERHYDIVLFDRINHKLMITDSGKRFYHFASKVVELYDDMEQSVTDHQEKGTISIGATMGIGSYLLPKLIVKYKELHPNVMVKSLISDYQNIQESLENNKIDIALIEGAIYNEEMEHEPFIKDPLVLLLPPNDPLSKLPGLSFDDIKDRPFLLKEEGGNGRGFIEEVFSSHGVLLDPIMESSSTHALVQAVHAGLGISILSEKLVSHSIESGFVSTNNLLDVPLFKQNYIVWHKGKFLVSSMLDFIKLCKILAE